MLGNCRCPSVRLFSLGIPSQLECQCISEKKKREFNFFFKFIHSILLCDFVCERLTFTFNDVNDDDNNNNNKNMTHTNTRLSTDLNRRNTRLEPRCELVEYFHKQLLVFANFAHFHDSHNGRLDE